MISIDGHRLKDRDTCGPAPPLRSTPLAEGRPAITGELDEATTATVLDLLEVLLATEGTAVLTVTHNPVVAERTDQRLVMRDGILVDAPPDPVTSASAPPATGRARSSALAGYGGVSVARKMSSSRHRPGSARCACDSCDHLVPRRAANPP